MSEKTPRQLGKEATVLRFYSDRAEAPLAYHAGKLAEEQDNLEWSDKIASGELKYDDISAEEAREFSKQSLQYIKAHQAGIDKFRPSAEARAQDAAAHYQENAAGYHDLAVLEAAMDGVHINVEKPEAVKEHPENS